MNNFFKKVLASVGIGGVRIDTRLATETVRPSQNLEGKVHIFGGKASQNIGDIRLFLMTEVLHEDNGYRIMTLEEYPIIQNIVVRPNENLEIDFNIPLPPDIPITIGRTRTWIQTGVEVINGTDPKDADALEVLPHPIADVILDALDLLGFKLKEAECVWAHPQMRTRLPIVQKLEYFPTHTFKGQLSELEVIFIPEGDTVDVFFEIDRRSPWYSFGYAEYRKVCITLTHEDVVNVHEVAHNLEQFLREYV